MQTKNKKLAPEASEPAHQELRCEVIDGRFVISIGIETLAFAYDHAENPDRYDDRGNRNQYPKVVEPLEFAKDVAHQFLNENEIGASPLTDAIDAMCEAAAEDGSLGVIFDSDDDGEDSDE